MSSDQLLMEAAIDLFAQVLHQDAIANSFDISKYCFDKQLKFIKDPAKFKIAVCSRRAGKTVGCAADMISTALTRAQSVSLYITLSRNNAKKIIWSDLLKINSEFRLGALTNETELSLKFPNGSVIYCSGAKDKTEIEKFRGLALTKCYIDETQSFKDYIRDLIDDVISKALFDNDGTLCLTGTPGPVPAGFFYDCWESSQWSKHTWTMFDNPWIPIKSGKSAWELVEQDCQRMGVSLEYPKIQRECFGRWTVDTDALVFKYNAALNDYTDLPALNGWHYIFGVDLGYEDSDAIGVLAWNDRSRASFLVEEILQAKQGITELANTLDGLIRKYNPDSIVMDTGGLGKKIAEEMNHRYGLPIQAAEKTRKLEYIELLNDALRTGRFMVKKGSRFGQDAMKVEWDRDSAQLKISDKFHSDICDAVLYAFRESLHWLHTPEKTNHAPQTPGWFKEQEKALEEAAFKAMESKNKLASDEILWDNSLSYAEEWE